MYAAQSFELNGNVTCDLTEAVRFDVCLRNLSDNKSEIEMIIILLREAVVNGGGGSGDEG
jgi:hypothetical protein